MNIYNEMVAVFEKANTWLLEKDKGLFDYKVSERTLCGALMLHLNSIISENEEFAGYYVDVEYNRNKGGIKTIRKTIRNMEEKIIPINCDLIVHSRGEHVEQDNLIAIEMKKSTRTPEDKNKDRERLIALTKDSFDDVWAFDGINLPEHVCRYILGVYYEINYNRKEITIEYYRKGENVKRYTIDFR